MTPRKKGPSHRTHAKNRKSTLASVVKLAGKLGISVEEVEKRIADSMKAPENAAYRQIVENLRSLQISPEDLRKGLSKTEQRNLENLAEQLRKTASPSLSTDQLELINREIMRQEEAFAANKLAKDEPTQFESYAEKLAKNIVTVPEAMATLGVTIKEALIENKSATVQNLESELKKRGRRRGRPTKEEWYRKVAEVAWPYRHSLKKNLIIVLVLLHDTEVDMPDEWNNWIPRPRTWPAAGRRPEKKNAVFQMIWRAIKFVEKHPLS